MPVCSQVCLALPCLALPCLALPCLALPCLALPTAPQLQVILLQALPVNASCGSFTKRMHELALLASMQFA